LIGIRLDRLVRFILQDDRLLKPKAEIYIAFGGCFLAPRSPYTCGYRVEDDTRLAVR
jgi:hypothetical protein